MDGGLIAQYVVLVAIAVGIPLFTVSHLRSNPAPLAIGIRWERRIIITSLILFELAMVPVFIPVVMWLLLNVGWLDITPKNASEYEDFQKAVVSLVVPAAMLLSVSMGVLLYFLSSSRDRRLLPTRATAMRKPLAAT